MPKIEISEELYKKIKKKLNSNKFDSVDSYIVYILEQVLLNLEKEENKTEDVFLSEEEKNIVKGRLKSLGYLH